MYQVLFAEEELLVFSLKDRYGNEMEYHLQCDDESRTRIFRGLSFNQ